MSSYLILHRDDFGGISEVPILYKSGELSEVGEWIASAMDNDALCWWWMVASDQAGLIAAQKAEIKELKESVKWLSAWRDKVREKLGPAFREAALA